MSDIDPYTPPKEGIAAALDAASKPSNSKGGIFKLPKAGKGDGMNAFKKWLGPKQYKQFESMLCQSITNSIKKDQKAANLASRKLRAVEKGQDPDEITS